MGNLLMTTGRHPCPAPRGPASAKKKFPSLSQQLTILRLEAPGSTASAGTPWKPFRSPNARRGAQERVYGAFRRAFGSAIRPIPAECSIHYSYL